MRNALLVLGFGAALSGCMQPMKPTASGHLGDQPPAPVGAIPPPVQTLPTPPRPKPTVKAETYSVVVNNVNVRELLFALARDAKVNVDIHPGIAGTVTLNAIDQTLPQLLSRISKQVDMRYELDGPNLAVMPDSPYLRIYKIDYVNIDRQTTGQISVSSEILGQTPGGASGGGASGGSAAGGGGGGQNSSRVQVQNRSENKFWDTLVENIKDVLRETDKVLPGSTVGAGPAPQPQPTSAGAPGAAVAPNSAQAASPNVMYREAASVIANREAGVLTVRATSRQHERIQEMLDQILASAKRQVLLEGTIVQVNLNNSYQQGIDWGIFTGGWQLLQGGLFRGVPQITPPLPTPTLGTSTTLPTNSFIGQYNSNTFRISLQLLETFGTVRVLSSPRVSAINNQTAVLKVVRNVVYFVISDQISQGTQGSQNLQAKSATPQVVPVGIILNVTPQISETDAILLNVRMSISSEGTPARDPVNPLNSIPQINVREMESVMKLSSGQVAVMGGLIEDQLQDTADTIPGVNRMPFFGDLFSNKDIRNSKSELVVFLRPIVIRDPSVDGDYRGYRVFLPGEDFMSQPNPGGPRRCEFPGIEGCPR